MVGKFSYSIDEGFTHSFAFDVVAGCGCAHVKGISHAAVRDPIRVAQMME